MTFCSIASSNSLVSSSTFSVSSFTGIEFTKEGLNLYEEVKPLIEKFDQLNKIDVNGENTCDMFKYLKDNYSFYINLIIFIFNSKSILFIC